MHIEKCILRNAHREEKWGMANPGEVKIYWVRSCVSGKEEEKDIPRKIKSTQDGKSPSIMTCSENGEKM